MTSLYPPLEYPPVGMEPNWWPVSAEQQAFLNCKAELALGGGQSGGGKLLGVEELIPTPAGFIRNGDLKDGDVIFGEDGKTYTVLRAHRPQIEASFRVTFDDGTHALVHAGHLWHTFTFRERQQMFFRSPEQRAKRRAARPKRGKGISPWLAERNTAKAAAHIPAEVMGKVRTTEEIMRTMSVANCERANHSIRLPKPVQMPIRSLPIHPYVLGCWLGDGHSQWGSLTIADAVKKETLKNCRDAGYHFYPMKTYAGKTPTYSCSGFTAKLRNLGVLNNKHIPEEYLWASIEQRLQLLSGLMDTDGCCNKDGQVEFWNMNEGLARGVYHLAASLGVKPFWREARATLYGKDCGPKFGVKWTAMLQCFKLKHKTKRLPKKVRATQFWRYIVNVEPAGLRAMRCITTSNPSGLYLFGRNFNVTHNTEVLAADAMQEYQNPRLRGLLIRTTLEEQQQLEDIQQKMYEPKGAQWWKKRWRFPSGATIRPGYLNHDKHLRRYQGNPYSWLGIDESGQHPEHRIRFMIGWLAAPAGSGLRVRGRFTSNPGDIGHVWQIKVFLRNRCPVHYPASLADDRPFETSVVPGKVYRGASWTDDSPVYKTTSFIPFRLVDNPFYDENKKRSLLTQSKAIQQQLLYGCWCNAAGLYFDFMRPDMVIPYATIGDSWWWQHFISIDYGYGNSSAAAGFYAINPNGVVFKTRERIELKMSALKFAQGLCQSGFQATDFPKQTAQEHWLKKFKVRDPEKPRISFCVMDEAMDQHRGTGKSVYDVMSEVFEKHSIGCIKAAHDPQGNAQVLYNGLANRLLILTRDSMDLPLGYRSLSTRIVDERKAVKKIRGAWEDDAADETMYAYNTWRQNSEKPARIALTEELEQMRKDGMDETSLARIAWQREQVIRKQEKDRGKGIRLQNF